MLSKQLIKNNIEFNPSANHNELLKFWWEKYRNDSIQEFYKAKREYIFEDLPLNFEINTKTNYSDYCTSEYLNKVFKSRQDIRSIEKKTNSRLPNIEKINVQKGIINKIGTTEKKIRILQEEDCLLLLMFEQLLGVDLDIKLKNISDLLEVTIPIKEKISGNHVFDVNGLATEVKAKYITENRKRKEFSILKKYINDRRLPELFEYFLEDEIPLEKIKLELESYNKAKEIVFDLVFKLEKALILKDKQGLINLIDDPKGHIQHKSFLLYLKNKELLNEKDYDFMHNIRNTFSHNQFPQKVSMELFISKWTESQFATQIVEMYKQKYQKIIKEINTF